VEVLVHNPNPDPPPLGLKPLTGKDLADFLKRKPKASEAYDVAYLGDNGAIVCLAKELSQCMAAEDLSKQMGLPIYYYYNLDRNATPPVDAKPGGVPFEAPDGYYGFIEHALEGKGNLYVTAHALPDRMQAGHDKKNASRRSSFLRILATRAARASQIVNARTLSSMLASAARQA
jgi:hypothetical protein